MIDFFFDVDNITPEMRIWSLIDSDATPENIFCSSLFFVMCASPSPLTYRRLVHGRWARKWIMNPWTHEELSVLCVVL